MRGYLGKDMTKDKQACHIHGCAMFRSDDCTDDPKTCRMLARMREQHGDASVKSRRRQGR